MPEPTQRLVDELAASMAIIEGDAGQSGPHWGAVHKLMLKLKVKPGEASRIIATRDLDGLRATLAELRGEEAPPAPAPAPVSPPSPPSPALDPPTMKAAMRAFRKRLKLTRLDHESRLGVGPLTGGKSHEVDAILPPGDFPPAVWRALVEAGKLRDVGRGFLALAEEVD